MQRRKSKDAFPWSAIERVEELQQVVTFPPLQDAPGSVLKKISGKTTYSYSVVRKDGRSFYFDNNVLPRSSLLAGPLNSAQREYNFPWFIESH